jgi:hypothetical protein
MIQDSIPDRDPCEDYWATYTRDVWVSETRNHSPLVYDPWVNGRYALAAVAWGLIALVVLGYGAGP